MDNDLEKLLEGFKTLHREISKKEKEILQLNLSTEEYKLFEKLSKDFKIQNKEKLITLAKNLYDKIKAILDVYQQDWKEQETVKSKLFIEIQKDLIKFCNEEQSTKCKEFLATALNDVFSYVVKEF